jgi:lysyl-tRNA synthetase class 2
MADAAPGGEEKLSKNELKRRQKAEEKAKAAAEKAAKKAEEAAKAPEKKKKDDGPALEEDEEDMDPSKFFENRLAYVNGLKTKGVNPYPHKFQSTIQLGEYAGKYGSVADGAQADAVEGVAGRVMSKRAGGKGLVFYDIHADGLKLQLFCDARNFSAFQGEDGLVGFMGLMNVVKRGDLVGVTGKPGKTKRGELSIFRRRPHRQGDALPSALPRPDTQPARA